MKSALNIPWILICRKTSKPNKHKNTTVRERVDLGVVVIK